MRPDQAPAPNPTKGRPVEADSVSTGQGGGLSSPRRPSPSSPPALDHADRSERRYRAFNIDAALTHRALGEITGAVADVCGRHPIGPEWSLATSMIVEEWYLIESHRA